MNIIRGEYFQSLADNKKIFYYHTHEVYQLFDNLPTESFVLITHNSDGKITDNPKRFNLGSSNDFDIRNISMPPNLIKWYAQNVEVINDKIESIPIGLENSIWFPEVQKENKILTVKNSNKIIKNLLYINHNISTNPVERQLPYDILSDNKWVTVVRGCNGQLFDDYLDNIHSHKFVLCPEGNGTDTHRTWETLYVGSIPIEKRNINNQFYKNLPICFVDNWSDITEDFLNDEYIRISNTNWNLEPIGFDYWKSKINSNI